MFENETTRILNAYSESKRLLKKLHVLIEPYEYGKEKHEQIFYGVVPNVLDLDSLENRAHNALTNVLKNNNLEPYYLPLGVRKVDDLSIKEHAKLINSITPDMFYYNAFYCDMRNKICYDTDKPGYSIGKNTYEEPRSYKSRMFLILNCIYLLDNSEPITREQEYKILNALDKNTTFIFNGCKVTLFKNDRLIIKFSSSELFERFQDKVSQAIKRLEKDLNGLEV